MKIFLTNVRKYNEGILDGEWLELPFSENDLKECLERIGINAEYEEYFITDYADSPYKINEYDNLRALNKLADLIKENIEDKDLVDSVFEYESPADVQQAIDIMERIHDNYCLYDNIDSQEDYGYYVVEEFYSDEVAKCNFLSNYIDYEGIGRDAELSGEIYFSKNGCLSIYR